MLRRNVVVFTLLLAPFAACRETVPPDEPPVDASSDSLGDSSSPDAGDAADSRDSTTVDAGDSSSPDASDASADASDASADADASDGSIPIPPRTGSCGDIFPAAASDGVFFDALWLGNAERRGARMVTGVDSSGRWLLWDLTTGARMAEGPRVASSGYVTGVRRVRGNVLLVSEGTGYETRDLTTGALLHLFVPPAVPHRMVLAEDGSYVVLVTDDGIELSTPGGTLIRSVPASALLTPGARPFTDGVFMARADVLWMGFAGPLENRFEIIPKAGPHRTVGPLPGALQSFVQDGNLALWRDASSGTTVYSVRDIDGVQRGVGLPGNVWGNYAFQVADGVVTVYSIGGPTAVPVASYTRAPNPLLTRSGYFLVAEGLVSLRGPMPILTPIPALPLANVTSLSVDETTGQWAMSNLEGQVAYGNASSYTTYGALGCGRLRSLAASQTGKLVLAFADHMEVIDTAAGRLDSTRAVKTDARVVVNEQGTLVVTEEPAAYDLSTWTKVGQWPVAEGLAVDITADGARVAVSGPTSIDERNPRGGALLASHAANTRASTRPWRFAGFSPDGAKLAVVRSILGPASAGAAITVTTDLYGASGTATFSAFPTFWRTNDVLEGESLRAGTNRQWMPFKESITWTGAGAGVPGAATRLPDRATATFTSYRRKTNGFLYTRQTVSKVDGSMTPWSVPTPFGPEPGLADFAGATFFWLDSDSGVGFERVRRHVF